MSRDVTIVLKAVDQYSTTLENFSQKVGGIGTNVGSLEESSKKADGALSGFTNKISGAIAAFAGYKGIQMIGDLLDLGTQANIAEGKFQSLTSKMGGYQNVLERIQDATGHIVDDKSLEQGANKLIGMNLANTSDELGKLLELATKLGTSGDVGKDISDFALMLSNNSIMRLDNFSISSGRVRERIIELQAATAGLSRSDAFKMAVLEEGSKTLERLGSAATIAETPLARIGVVIQNMGQDFAQDFSTGANSLAGILEIAAGQNPAQLDQAKQEAQAQTNAAAVATVYAQQYHEALGAQFQSLGTADLLLQKSLAITNLDPSISSDAAVSQAYSQLTYNDTVGTSDEELSQMQQVTYAMLEQKKAAEDAQKAQADLVSWQETGQALAQTRDRWVAFGNTIVSHVVPAIQQIQAHTEEYKQAVAEYNTDIATVGNNLFNITGDSNPMSALYTSKMTSDQAKGMLPQFMDGGDAGVIIEQYRQAQDELVKLHQLADQKLISDDQITQAENLTSNLGLMADQAQKAADAFKNMKLSDVFGQTGGGMAGEISDLVMQQMKAGGASPDQIAAMQTALDKGSGRETDTSEEMKTVIAPMIAKMSTDKAVIAMTNLDAMLKEAVLEGLSQDKIAALMPKIAGSGFDLTNQMPNFIASQTMTTSSGSKMFGDVAGNNEGTSGSKGKGELTTTVISKDMSSIAKDSTTVDKNLAAINASTTAAAKVADTFQKAINSIPDTKKVVFDFSMNDPMGLVDLVKKLLGGNLSLAGLVRDNGGSVPGSGHHAGNGGV